MWHLLLCRDGRDRRDRDRRDRRRSRSRSRDRRRDRDRKRSRSRDKRRSRSKDKTTATTTSSTSSSKKSPLRRGQSPTKRYLVAHSHLPTSDVSEHLCRVVFLVVACRPAMFFKLFLYFYKMQGQSYANEFSDNVSLMSA